MPGYARPNIPRLGPPRSRDGGARRHHDVVAGTSVATARAVDAPDYRRRSIRRMIPTPPASP